MNNLELHTNWKRKRLDDYKEAITRIQSYGITVNGCFILGLDGDTPEIFEEIHDFVKDSGLYEVQITLMTPFPGTPLYARLKRENRIIRDQAWELCTLLDLNIVPKNMTCQELQSGFLQLAKSLYSAEETEARRKGFKERLKASPNFRKDRNRPEKMEPEFEVQAYPSGQQS